MYLETKFLQWTWTFKVLYGDRRILGEITRPQKEDSDPNTFSPLKKKTQAVKPKQFESFNPDWRPNQGWISVKCARKEINKNYGKLWREKFLTRKDPLLAGRGETQWAPGNAFIHPPIKFQKAV